jgi:Retrotransposon gag protein/Zinc knuckle
MPAKIQPLSKFNGEIGAALEVWKRELESHFDYYSSTSITTEEERLRYAVVHLGDAARTWWNSVRDVNRITTYSAFNEALNDRYRPVLAAQQARTQLRALRQSPRQMVSDYINSFQTLMAHIPDMSDADQVHSFTCGLQPAVGQKVREVNPTNLAAAIGCAVRFEGSIGIGAATYRLPMGGPGGVAMDLGAVTSDASIEIPSATSDATTASVLAQLTSQLNALVSRLGPFPSPSSSSSSSFGRRGGARSDKAGKEGRVALVGMGPGVIRDRISKRLCIKCGEAGHFVSDCKNQQKNL